MKKQKANDKMIVKDETILRQKSVPVQTIEEIEEIIEKLEHELRLNNNGVGLAAPQIGILKQVAIIRTPHCNLNIINPTNITLSDDKFVFKDEGCLSFPGVRKNTLRSRVVSFIGKNEKLEDIKFEISLQQDQLVTVAVQHEIGHLFGEIFFDYTLKPTVGDSKKVGRNDPCPCGSNKKFKKCCGR